jgi:hypothetical protein
MPHSDDQLQHEIALDDTDFEGKPLNVKSIDKGIRATTSAYLAAN